MEVKCRNKVFEIFTEGQAVEKGIIYRTDWQNAQRGDWILTSDGKVIECLGRSKMGIKKAKKPVYAIRTGFGKTPEYRKRIYANKQPDYGWDIYLKGSLTRKVKSTALQQKFLEYLVDSCVPDKKGMWMSSDLIQAYMTVYCENNPTSALKRAYWILKKDTSKEFISMAMKDTLQAAGIDDDYVADKIKDFIEDKTAPHSVRLQALKQASELLGHNDKIIIQETEETEIMLTESEKKELQSGKEKFTDKLMN